MIKLPKEIKSIKGSRVFTQDETVKVGYTLNEEKVDETYISVELPYNYGVYLRHPKSIEIIDDSRDFVNGFKVVQTANLEYAYVREEDNKLLPYRYDIATNFNEYGYAMVGKDANVSWIDRDFRYFNAEEEKFTEEYGQGYTKFNGFLGVSDFSKGDNSLSRLYRFRYDNTVSYLDTNGKIKEFYEYDGNIVRESEPTKYFSYLSTEFNDKGYAVDNDDEFILLSTGYYLSIKDLIKVFGENGFLNIMNKKIEKQEQSYTKFLRDIEEKTTMLAENLSKVNNLIAEYGIEGIELRKEELISRYGEDTYERALTNRSLVYLIVDEEIPTDIVDLELFQSSLAKRGIPSYIDKEENVFYYNANKHVKTKK